MAINLATKYSDKVDEVFKLGALTTSMAGRKRMRKRRKK